jgi:hypothetical protein
VSIPGIAQEYSDIKGKVWLTEEEDNTCVLHMCATISIKGTCCRG